MRLDFSTIAAISTPPGTGGIGVIRISGPEAPDIAAAVFRRARTDDPIDLRAQESHRVFFGRIRDSETGETIDEVLLTWMAAPHTFTTEDTVEISCHGGPVPLRETLRVVLGAGARHAEPGEFTLRAFLHGRLDLAQAEAVVNVVGARTAEGLRLAVDDLRGDLTRRIAPARDAVVRLLAYLDAAADFPEDEIPADDVDADLALALEAIEQVVAGARSGMLYRDGAQVALVGRPNVGKSSLMNALLRSDRAIVTPIAGTTRDVIAETSTIRGIPVTLLDTAGIAETVDVVERLGIERSQRALSAAAAAILVLDGSDEPSPDDFAVVRMLATRLAFDPSSVFPGTPPVIPSEAEESLVSSPVPSSEEVVSARDCLPDTARDSSTPLRSGRNDNKALLSEGNDTEDFGDGRGDRSPGPERIEPYAPIPVLIAINKRDLPVRASQEAVIGLLPGATVIEISSRTGEGLDALERALANLLEGSGSGDIRPALITTRQRAALDRARMHLREAKTTRAGDYPLDLMATDVRAALHAIGEVTGENVDEAVLDEIFSRFCIGK
jgi:tRNA modification GTPase